MAAGFATERRRRAVRVVDKRAELWIIVGLSLHVLGRIHTRAHRNDPFRNRREMGSARVIAKTLRHVQGTVAFVTGSTSGIGLGIAVALLEAGMKVGITDRGDDLLQQALKRMDAFPRATVHPIEVDVADRGAVAAAAVEGSTREIESLR